MAPGFTLVLIVVTLAALAPIVVVALAGGYLFASWRAAVIRCAAFGATGGLVIAVGFAFLGCVLRPEAPIQPEVWLVVFAAAFSGCALCVGAAAVIGRRLFRVRGRA